MNNETPEALPTEAEALRWLYHANIKKENDPANQSRQETYLKILGYTSSKTERVDPIQNRVISATHREIRHSFIVANSSCSMRNEEVMEFLEKQMATNLGSLCACGIKRRSLLHELVDLDTYVTHDYAVDFGKLKPLIRFLLIIITEFPKWLDDNDRVPIYLALASSINPELKSEIVQFFCGKQENAFLESTSAIQSLGMTGRYGHFTAKPISRDYLRTSKTNHALHKAVEDDVFICEDILGSEILRPCLALLDNNGSTCLHAAVKTPETEAKRQWAERLVKIDDRLLAIKNGDGLTPLQCLTSTNSKRLGIGTWLKIRCLTSNSFSNNEARSIIYRPHMMRHTDFSSLEEGDIVSTASLSSKHKHFKLDLLLRIVYIPHVTVLWDSAAEETIGAELKDCFGRSDYCLIFRWLRDFGQVSRVIKIVVDDMNTADPARISHSDEAIVHCLKNLKVKIWDWKKIDISSDVIYRATPAVEEVYLYCSGNNAILRSWSDSQGLILLQSLKKLHLEINQGLEPRSIAEKHVECFISTLKRRFMDRKKRDISVKCTILKNKSESARDNCLLPRLKEEEEEGYEEQEWLKCMDDFADFVDDPSIFSDKSAKVKVALIDDGVKSSYDNLDDSIDDGESWVKQSDWQEPQSPYLTSIKGHGTVMAYFIRRVCPNVRLYVLKLSPIRTQNGITFSIESATKAIEWAIEKRVDIISMSWAIDEIPAKGGKDDERVTNLREAIRKATESENMLLFCAWPDKGAGVENRTYPRFLSTNMFAIAAGTREGQPSPQVGDGKPDFVLPGVGLGIPVALSGKMNTPSEKYDIYTGSSLSCALAAGLAAMILYCARKIDSPHAISLKGHKYMKEAFQSLKPNKNGWIAVSQMFGQPAITKSKPSERTEILKQLVESFFGQMDLREKLANHRAAKGDGMGG